MKWFNIFNSDHLWSGPAAQFDQRKARPGEGTEEGDVQVGNNILLKDYYNFHFIRFSCNRGYRLVGQHRVYCTRRGWNLNTPPVCASKKK